MVCITVINIASVLVHVQCTYKKVSRLFKENVLKINVNADFTCSISLKQNRHQPTTSFISHFRFSENKMENIVENIDEKNEQAERFEKDHGYDSAGKFNLV